MTKSLISRHFALRHILLLQLMILFCCPATPASMPVAPTTTLIASTLLPLEFQFLVESYQRSEARGPKREKFLKLMKELDVNFVKLPKKYLYFIVKMEIYHSILEKADNSDYSSLTINKSSIKILNEKINENFHLYTSFSRWLIESIQSDIWEISDYIDLDRVNETIKNTVPIDTNEKMIKKNKIKQKINLITPWYKLLLEMNAEDFNQHLLPIMEKIFETILEKTNVLIANSNFIHKKVPSLSTNSQFYNFEVLNSINATENSNKKSKTEDVTDVTNNEFGQYQKKKRDSALKFIDELKIPPLEEDTLDSDIKPALDWTPRDPDPIKSSTQKSIKKSTNKKSPENHETEKILPENLFKDLKNGKNVERGTNKMDDAKVNADSAENEWKPSI
ncbi:MAG: hypothetical protein HQK53_06925 [Oligoflexia bacterium]|nr:hypothetical protein [Oligoflexia bacterium]